MTSKSWGDLKKQADDASKPLPKDWYDVGVSKAEVVTASTGSLMIKAQMKVIGGPYNGRMLFTNFVLSTENSIALSIFFRNLAAFGLDDAFFASLTGADSDPNIGLQTAAAALLGRTARAEVGTRVWQGQERNEVNSFAPAQGGPGAPNLAAAGNLGVSSPAVPAGLGGGGAPVPSIPSTPPTPVAPPAGLGGEAPPAVPAF